MRTSPITVTFSRLTSWRSLIVTRPPMITLSTDSPRITIGCPGLPFLLTVNVG